MSLSCVCDFLGSDWWFEIPLDADFETLNTKRSRRCWSCGEKIRPGDEVVRFKRYREPVMDIEQDIVGDEVPLADGYFCEKCGGLALRLQELGFCYHISKGGAEPLAQQIKEYFQWEREKGRETQRNVWPG